jgi:predicted phage-related endonuclease
MLPDGAEYAFRHIQAQYPEGKNVSVELPTDIKTKIAELGFIKREMKDLEATEDRLKAELTALMGEAEYATIGGNLALTWKNSVRNSLDLKQLEAAHPALVEKFKKQTNVRTFRVTTKGDK